MYVAPNSDVRLLSNVPLDKNQTDTLWFDSVASQTDYFIGKTARVFTKVTYQRVNRGYARLPIGADNAYNCNYMMFKNTSFGNKWFYAFIDKVEYINNEVTEIQFTIDPVQTWLFDYHISDCYIERLTPAKDDIGDNILPEPIALSEYVANNDYKIIGNDSSDLGFVCAMVDPAHSADFFGGGIYDGVVSGAKLYAFDGTASGISLFNSLILESNAVRQAPDSLIMMYMCPKMLLPPQAQLNSESLADHLISPNNTAHSTYPSMSQISKSTELDGYTPRNAKCYTYPYTFYHSDNGQGQGLITRYEFCTNLQPQFHITANLAYPVELVLMPYAYKNVRGDNNINTEYRGEKLSIKGYPQCSWSQDAFAAWVAQNSVPILIDAVSTAVPIVAGGITGGLAGAGQALQGQAGSIIGQITSIAKSAYSASISADITRGSFQTGSNDVMSKRLVFKGCTMTQPKEVMRTIDTFFDAFGYAQHTWTSPQRRTRVRWTYVKTIGANVSGNLPSDDSQYIANCYDKGIRFWADTYKPGDYSINNGFLS